MLDPVFRTVEQLVLEFSWKRVLYVFLILLLAGAIIGVLEWYTSYLHLMRVGRAAEILAVLQQAEIRGVTSDPDLAVVYRSLLSELQAASSPRTLGWRIPEAPTFGDLRPVWKFLAGAGPLWAVGFVGYVASRNVREGLAVLAATFLLSVAFGGLGLLIPTIAWPWVNLILYPVSYLLILAGFGLLISRKEEHPRMSKAYEEGETTMM